MFTHIAYFDETGDDGNKKSSSDTFVLTSLSMPCDKWHDNFDEMRQCRKTLKSLYGFHSSQEMHTKHFLTDKSPYREYGWDTDVRIAILKYFIFSIGKLDAEVINVIIDKNNIRSSDYDILDKALTYNIQRIENSSNNEWNYILVTDEGRLAPMRKIARKRQVFNPIQSMYDSELHNRPIRLMIEDMFEKNSKDSYFIQVCVFISYFVHLYYSIDALNKPLPTRVGKLIDEEFVIKTMTYFKNQGLLNINANASSEFGLVIYPKK